jgi:hypothetical protein
MPAALAPASCKSRNCAKCRLRSGRQPFQVGFFGFFKLEKSWICAHRRNGHLGLSLSGSSCPANCERTHDRTTSFRGIRRTQSPPPIPSTRQQLRSHVTEGLVVPSADGEHPLGARARHWAATQPAAQLSRDLPLVARADAARQKLGRVDCPSLSPSLCRPPRPSARRVHHPPRASGCA